MPKPTFLALPDGKRYRFVAVALHEFTEHGYDLASVSRIVAELGIAKGSVYQYFDDKFDLFVYLLEESGRRKVAAVAPDLPAGTDVWHELRAMYTRGLAFWRAEPRWAALGLRLLEPSQEPRLRAMRAQVDQHSHGFVRGLLATARERGQIRADLDLDTSTHLVTAVLSTGLLHAFLARSGQVPGTWPDGPLQVDDAVLLDVVDQALVLIRRGLA